jgi:hypothetical protein
MTERWEYDVQAALVVGDTQRLRELFAAAVLAEGAQTAARSWLAAVAAFDADAQTG